MVDGAERILCISHGNALMVSVGFLGAGQMATSLAKGWQARGLLKPGSLACDVNAEARSRFQASTGLPTTASAGEVADAADVLMIAVKPQHVADLLASIRANVSNRHLVLSIAAGLSLDRLASGLPDGTRLVRLMPNTPALIQRSATAFSLGRTATEADGELVARLFGTVGLAVPVPESQLDAVTGLSGSGPAYVYVMIEALADGGVRMGLPRETALKLAAQTVIGAAEMVLQTGSHPAALKDAVASPGGTTMAGLHALERAGFRGAIIDAVQAATLRAMELGKN